MIRLKIKEVEREKPLSSCINKDRGRLVPTSNGVKISRGVVEPLVEMEMSDNWLCERLFLTHDRLKPQLEILRGDISCSNLINGIYIYCMCVCVS